MLQAHSRSLQRQFCRPTQYFLEITLIALIGVGLGGASFEWKSYTETGLRAPTSHTL